MNEEGMTVVCLPPQARGRGTGGLAATAEHPYSRAADALLDLPRSALSQENTIRGPGHVPNLTLPVPHANLVEILQKLQQIDDDDECQLFSFRMRLPIWQIAPILCTHSVMIRQITAVTISGEPDCLEITLATLIADLPGAIAWVLALSLEQKRVHLVIPRKSPKLAVASLSCWRPC